MAQGVSPGARVVYVDIDPIVLAHGQALLEHPTTRELIDRGRPVAVLLIGLLHHLHDDEAPQGIVDAYLDAVPAGSHLAISHFCDVGPEARELQETFLTFLGTGRFRTIAEISGYFRGLEMAEPGVVPLPAWRPDGSPPGELTLVDRLMAAGVARKP